MSTWYAVMCKPRCKARAEFNLRDQDYRVFVLLEFLGKINKVKINRDWQVSAA